MAGLTGNTTGVGKDITDYLQAVAEHFKITIEVTSGKRTADDQARAMWNNWIKLQRGAVYNKLTLPEEDRKKLDNYYVKAKDNAKTTLHEKEEAEAEFLKLAKARIGDKSKHTKGRAVDVRKASIGDKVHRAIEMGGLKEVKEGDRDDIYHFESSDSVKTADDAMKQAWTKL